MQNFYHNFFISFMCVFVPVSVNAMSSIKDDNAIITMRNDNPCFSYPRDKEIQKVSYLFSYLSVSKNGPQGGAGWEIGISNLDKRGLLDPNSLETCIEYGVLNPGMKEKQAAEPLLPETPYRVFIRVAEASGGRNIESRKFLSDFCLSRNEKGEPTVVDAEWRNRGGWYCLKPGESPKRGFWRKLFGK